MTSPNLATPTDAIPKGLVKGWVLIIIAAIVSFGLYQILPYDQNANKGLALLCFIGILWLTEAIHITITALLVPILAVILAMPMAKGDELVPITTQAALTTFADPTIFLFFGSQMIGNYYLPIYFQTVRDKSPAISGVYILPSIAGMMFMGVLSGFAVSKWGYYLPWQILSGVLAGIGNGLLSMMDPHTPAVEWAWFQIITGFGRGAGMQMVRIRPSIPSNTFH